VRILHINTFDCVGGAARSANRLHEGLRVLGADSRMYVLNKTSYDPSVLIYEPPLNFSTRVPRIARREILVRSLRRYENLAPHGLGNFSDDRAVYARDPWRRIPEHDVINLHWVVGFVDYTAFFASLCTGTPVVWTLHDMAPFTGGCHWNQGCLKFLERCGACPQLGSLKDSDWTRRVWQRKMKSLAELPSEQLHIVTPSKWLQEERKQSSLFSRFSGSVIPYGLDTDLFAPRDPRTARDVLGVPLDAKIVLFLADGVNIPRKGFHILAEALTGIDTGKKVILLSLGPGALPVSNTFAHIHIGPIQNDRFLSFVYSAADVFVASSLHDNLPNTILESFASGTPVVAFDVGGIPDAVRPGVTGLLAKPGDSASLRVAIENLLSNDDRRREMSSNCRRIAVQEYSLKIQAQRYIELYQRMLHRSEGPDKQVLDSSSEHLVEKKRHDRWGVA
jgi:glycosyltransferase involved in cell wall biosynthesis